MKVLPADTLKAREGSIESPSAVNGGERWVSNLSLLWDERAILFRVGIASAVLSALLAFVIMPKEYESTCRIMPPDQNSGGASALLSALAGRGGNSSSSGLGALAGGGGLAALAGSMFGIKNTGALFVELLHSRTIQEHLVDQFNLQAVYSKRYKQDTIKKLGRRTDVTEDRKSGVISIVVTDTDRQRARDLAQAYVDQLDGLLSKVNTSSARRERQFIEQRLGAVRSQLQNAEIEFSEFSSRNTTLDIKEQTRAMVDAGAKLQAELVVGRTELDSLQQIYGVENARVRTAQARVSMLQRELDKLAGTSDIKGGGRADRSTDIYPPLRQLPILGVRWAELYRETKIQENVLELLTTEYEAARIEEAKSIPTVRVVDPANWPEKKSFPPRILITLALTSLSLVAAGILLLARERWRSISIQDPRKLLAQRVWLTLKYEASRYRDRLPYPH